MAKIGEKEALFVFKKMKSELIHNMVKAEGSQLSPIETKTLIDDKVTPNGANVEDVEQALRLNRAFNEITRQIEQKTFNTEKENFIKINALVAVNEALEVGDFRDRQVYIANTKYTPLERKEQLEKQFNEMKISFNKKTNIEEKASDLFLDSARNQYFYDGNKRTAQLLMNGYLVSKGYSPRSIANESLNEYNQKMTDFYETNNKEKMYDFLGKSQALVDTQSRAKNNEKEPLEPEVESFRNKVIEQAEKNNFSTEQLEVLNEQLEVKVAEMDKELKQQKVNEDEQER